MEKKEKVSVSIIVPVYNVENYLPKCLESLVKQTLDSLEIIVVNDGSPDNSQKVIDFFVKKHPQKVRPFIKDNGGLGDARNFGVKQANGKYLAFVDSDDWVELNAFENLYKFAENNNYDLVIFDNYNTNSSETEKHVSLGYYANLSFNKKNAILASIQPAHAWNKLYKRSLFNNFMFEHIWYEDIGTIPAVLTYAHNIGYLKEPLYYYRQAEGSITKNQTSKKNLEVVLAWENVLKISNPEYLSEIKYAVYKSIVDFMNFRPLFSVDYLNYFLDNQDLFKDSIFIENDIKEKCLKDLTKIELIPKKIHYCWFGGGEKSKLIRYCMDTWKEMLPDYEIIEWNESNCDMSENKYVAQAYGVGKWAFVADFFRFKILYENGGLYFDTDVQVNNRFEYMRMNKFFMGFETHEDINVCVMGGCKGHALLKSFIDSYENDSLIENGVMNISYPVPRRVKDVLIRSGYNLIFNGQEQDLGDGIHIYPANAVAINVYDGKSAFEHHYDASWWDVKTEVSYKHIVLKDYFIYPLSLSDNIEYGKVVDDRTLVDTVLSRVGLKKVFFSWAKKKLKKMVSERTYIKIWLIYRKFRKK